MKSKVTKRVLAAVLAGTFVFAMSATALAQTTEQPAASVSGGEATEVEHIPTTSSVAGAKTSCNGYYLASKLNGSIVVTGADAIAVGYGLNGNEKPFVKFSNFDGKKSYLSNACLEAIAASQKATMCTKFNLELGKMTSGHYSLLPSTGAPIVAKVGIPKNDQVAGATYAIAKVVPGGAFAVLADTDNDPATVTFSTTGGQGAYAIIRY